MGSCVKVVALGWLLWALAVVDCRALDSLRAIDQFQHTAWSTGDGAPPDIWALAQGPDGFLWLATGAGLYRFDGVAFERIQPAGNRQFLSMDITSIATRLAGDVWVGYYAGGVSRLKDGFLTNFTVQQGFPAGRVFGIAIESSGVVWAAAKQGLARYDGKRWQIVGADWNFPPYGALYVMISRDGTLWVTTDKSIVCLRPHARRFQTVLEPALARARPAEAPDGTIWISEQAAGIFALSGPDGRLPGRPSPARPGSNGNILRAKSLLFDREGVLWAADADHGGIFRVLHPSAHAGALQRADIDDVFDRKSGLTSDIAVPLLEDSEHDVWVGTNLGLDRFRDVAFSSVRQIPDMGKGFAFGRRPDGSLLIVNRVSLFHAQNAESIDRVMALPQLVSSLFVGQEGTVWLGGISQDWKSNIIARLDGSRLTPIPLPKAPAENVLVLTEDRDGGLIAAFDPYGIMRYKDHAWSVLRARPTLPSPGYGTASRDSHGRLWIGYPTGVAALIDHGSARFFSARDGLSVGDIATIEDEAGIVWIGGDEGLARFDGQRFDTIDAKRIAPFRGISGIVASTDDAVWLNGIFGIVRVGQRDLLRAFRDRDFRLPWRLFDYRDGVVGAAQQGAPHTALAGRDGTLWFITNQGIVTADPGRLRLNARPPPVQILGLAADGRSFPLAGAALSPGTSDIRIDYTAPSLPVPERVQFRYRLEGLDKTWTDAGTRRQAFYTNLSPGDYRFRVIASNNDGVWNTAGASLAFSVQPTFFQTRFFYALCAAVLLLVLWLLYSLRLRQVTARLTGMLEERLRERERIARELHDTFLQGIQGLILEFQAIANRIPAPEPVHQQMERALERADNILVEGRESVHDLRASHEDGDVARDFEDAIAELPPASPRCALSQRGQPRRLHPVIREEILKIGREALINACRHAQATTVQIELTYMYGRFRLRVRDDGAGIAAEVLARGEREGHYGLKGMRERAERIKSVVSVVTAASVGTEIELRVPARIAYMRPPRAATWLSRLQLILGV